MNRNTWRKTDPSFFPLGLTESCLSPLGGDRLQFDLCLFGGVFKRRCLRFSRSCRSCNLYSKKFKKAWMRWACEIFSERKKRKDITNRDSRFCPFPPFTLTSPFRRKWRRFLSGQQSLFPRVIVYRKHRQSISADFADVLRIRDGRADSTDLFPKSRLEF